MSLTSVLAVFVAILWAVSYVVAVITSNYTGISLTTPVMLIASGFLLKDLGRHNGPN